MALLRALAGGGVSGRRRRWIRHQHLEQMAAASQPAGDAVAAAFAKYNRNGDGLLDLEELRVLLDDAHFEFDASYVNGIADM